MASRVLNGDNGGVTENTFFHHVKQLEDLKRQASSIAGKISAQKKLAKDDGLDMKDLKWALEERAKSTDQQVASHNRRVAYLKYLKMPVGMALTPLDEIKDETGLTEQERQEKWENDGFVAGKLGLNRDTCPHEDPNSMGARFWMAGYDKGQAKNAEGIKRKPAAEKPAAETPPAPASKAKPKPEPEVVAANAKKSAKKGGGVTYWHNVEMRKVFAITPTDADAPKGSVSLTKPEYEKLKADYDAEFDAAAKEPPAADEGKVDDFDSAEPPAPGSKPN